MSADRSRWSSWQPATRFVLSPHGITAIESYRAKAVGSPPRISSDFEPGRWTWAESLQLHHEDALYLGEVLGGAKTLDGIIAGFQACGRKPDEILAALQRLVDAGLLSTMNAS
jgi:hypothetical protein